MKISFRHSISALLCAGILCTMMPGIVTAEEEIPAEEEILFITEEETLSAEDELLVYDLPPVFQINPLYEDVLTEEEIITAPALYTDSSSEVPLSEYISFGEACDLLRQNMIERQGTIHLYIHMVSPSAEEISGIIGNVLNEALAHTGKPKEGDSLRWQWAGYDCSAGTYSYIEEDYYFSLPFLFTYYTTAEQEAELDLAVDALITEILPEDASDFETVKAAYDWLCENVQYDHANLNNNSYTLKFTPYAALFDRTCVCQGYALLMYRLMLEQGIDCRLIAGDGGGPHAWNIVRLGDVYYNLDATWDAGHTPEEYQWFLLNEESFVDHIRYNNSKYGYYDSDEFHEAYPMAEENYFSGDEIRTEGILDEENNITWTLSMDGTLTISGEGAMPNFVQDGYVSPEYLPWNHLRGNITKIVVEPGITSLGIGAFMASENAVSAEIADTITAIDQYAFADCSSLTEICFFGNAPQISSNAFTGVTASAYYPTANTTWTDAVLQDYGGTITWEVLDSFEISTADDLFLFAELVNRGHNSMNGVLLNDITVNENVLNADGNLCADPSELIEWTPIGSLSRPYLGTFNGGGYTVSGLYFDDTTAERVGFFGRAGNKESNTYYGLIQNLTVADSYFSAKSSVGGIAGANGGAQIQNCFNSSTIAARQGHSGGIAGYCSGPVTNCENTGAVRGSAQTGGITGSIYESYIRYCNNTAPVTGTDSVGGIAGYKATYSTVEYCTNSGAIGGTTSVGGIVGDNRVDSISNCANYGSITGSSKTGGIVGNVYYGNVQNCFDNAAGSIIGYNSNGSASANYYLAETETDSFGGTAAVTFAQCRSGEVAFLLGSAWGQTIGEEDFPVLGGAKVYAAADGSPCPGYTNSADGIREHEFEDGVCRWCGAPEFTADNYDVNGDGELTEADALCLLRHTILPDRYPLAVDNADFDGDGSVTAGDAVSLLNSIRNITAP